MLCLLCFCMRYFEMYLFTKTFNSEVYMYIYAHIY